MVSETNAKMMQLPLPSGPSNLCFTKEVFMKDDFIVDQFVIDCRRRVPLETLREDLGIYLKILQNALIELINKDYADFVNLSSNLVGLDKAITNLTTPLAQLKEEILRVQSALDSALAVIQDRLDYQMKMKAKKACLERMICIYQSVDKMEKLLCIQSSQQGQSAAVTSGELDGQLIERVATEFNKLQFYVSKSRGQPLVDKIKPRITNITTKLQYSLEGSFITGLESGDVDVLRQCLRTYATIDKISDAENLFRQNIARPYLMQVISEQGIRNNPQGLMGMYNNILAFIPKHCQKLKKVTSGEGYGGEVIRGYDFLVNAVWPEIVSSIEARASSIFAPGNPNLFHQKYKTSIDFLRKFEMCCGSQASVKRLHAHPTYNLFITKWSLPVYYQIRFQEIGSELETALLDPLNTHFQGKECFNLLSTHTLWKCLERTWHPDVFLPALSHRFWKLTMHLLSRYTVWVKDVGQQKPEKQPDKPETESTHLRPGGSEATTMTHSVSMPNLKASEVSSQRESESSKRISQLAYLVSDAQTLIMLLPQFFTDAVESNLLKLGIAQEALKEAFGEAGSNISMQLPQYDTLIVEDIVEQCAVHLKLVSDTPRLYRRTNREVPKKASVYVTNLLKPLHTFLSKHEEVVKEETLKAWLTQIISNISNKYYEVTDDVLTSVKKMEESLKRLKKAKGASASRGNFGISDDDKIRLQLYLDVVEFGKLIGALSLDKDDIEAYVRLYKLVESAKNTSQST